MTHSVLASPDFTYVGELMLLIGALAIAFILGVVALNVRARLLGPPIVALVVVGQWMLVMRAHVVGPFDLWTALYWLQVLTLVAIVDVLLLAVVWARRMHVPIIGIPAAVGCLVGAAAVGVIEPVFTVARLTGSPDAYRVLVTACQWDSIVCNGVAAHLCSPDVDGVLAWVASTPDAPPDVLYALGRSTNAIVQTRALRNANLAAAAFTDTTILGTPNGRYAIADNPRLTTAGLNALLGRDHDIAFHLIFQLQFMHNRADTSTLRLLGVDTSAAVRAAVARSPRTPADALAALALDSVPSVREAAAATLRSQSRSPARP